MDRIIKTRIVKNTLFVSIAQVVNMMLQMIYIVFTARYLGNVQFGKLSFAIAFTQMFLSVTDFGLFNYAVREISKNKERSNNIFVNLFILKSFLGVTVLSVIAIIVFVLGYPSETVITVVLFGVGLWIFSLNTSFHAVFQSFEKLKYISLTMICFFVVNVSLSMVVLALGKNIITLACINCLAGGVVFIVNSIILIKYFFVPKFTFDIRYCKKMLLMAAPIAIGAVFCSFYNRIDVALLSFLKGDVSVGEYTAAYRLTNTFALIPHAFLSAVFPIMAREGVDISNTFLIDLCKKSCRLMIAAAFFFIMILNLFAPMIIEFLYGGNYTNATTPLRILSFAILFTFVSNIFAYILISKFKTSRDYTIYAVLGFVINIVVNMILIPLYGIKGAAICTVVTELFIFIMYYRAVWKSGIHIILSKDFLKHFFVSFLVLGIVYFLKIDNIAMLLIVLAFYIFSIIMVRAVQINEIKNLFDIVRGTR